MKKLITALMCSSVLFLNSCATTGNKVGPKYHVGSCLQPTASELAQLEPEDAAMLKLTRISVIDMGTKFYVVELRLNGKLLQEVTMLQSDLDGVSIEVPCPAEDAPKRPTQRN